MPKKRRVLASLVLLVALMGAALPQPAHAGRGNDGAAIPDLATFVTTVGDGRARVIRGVYAGGLFALLVVQQQDKLGVSRVAGTVTQFETARTYGVVGLLAHNNLSGRQFFALDIGQPIQLVYGDGRIEGFRVTRILHFRATIPKSADSSLIDLETGEEIGAEGVFRRVYMGGPHVTFQTCIENEGISSWGRLFVIAEPQASVSVGGPTP